MDLVEYETNLDYDFGDVAVEFSETESNLTRSDTLFT